MEDGTVQVVQEFFAQTEPDPERDADILGGHVKDQDNSRVKTHVEEQRVHRATTNAALGTLKKELEANGIEPGAIFQNQGDDLFSQAFGDNSEKLNPVDWQKKIAQAKGINYPKDWQGQKMGLRSATTAVAELQAKWAEAKAQENIQTQSILHARYTKMFTDLLDNEEVMSVQVPKSMLGVGGTSSSILNEKGHRVTTGIKEQVGVALNNIKNYWGEMLTGKPGVTFENTSTQQKYGNRAELSAVHEYRLNRLKLFTGGSHSVKELDDVKKGISKMSTKDADTQKISQDNILRSLASNRDGNKEQAAKGNITIQGGLQINPGFLPMDPSGETVKVHYTYFGALVNSALRLTGHDSIPPKARILLGTYTWSRPGSKNAETFPLADFPVSMDLFRAWLVKTVVAPAKSSLALKDYLESMIETLVHGMLQQGNSGCFGGNDPANRTHTKWDTFEAPSSAKGRDRLPRGRVTVETVSGLMMKPLPVEAVHHPGYGSRNYILLHATNEKASEQFGVSEAADDKKGCYWLSVGLATGPIKEFKFERLEETRDEYFNYMESKEGGNVKVSDARKNLLQQKDLQQMYKAQVQILGNSVLKINGDVFVNINGIGAAKDHSIARGLGFGGTYKVIKKEGKIDSTGWWEDVECYPTPMHEAHNRQNRLEYWGKRRSVFEKKPEDMTPEELAAFTKEEMAREKELEAAQKGAGVAKRAAEQALRANEVKAAELRDRRIKLFHSVLEIQGIDMQLSVYQEAEQWFAQEGNKSKQDWDAFMAYLQSRDENMFPFEGTSLLLKDEFTYGGKISLSAYWNETDLAEAEEFMASDAITGNNWILATQTF